MAASADSTVIQNVQKSIDLLTLCIYFLVLNDYCYTFDTRIRQWTKVLFQGGGPGPRFGHSGKPDNAAYTDPIHSPSLLLAVSYGNDSLFVMFGVNSNGNVVNDAYVLNTTTFTWTAIPSTNGTTGSDSTQTGASGIGTGAIVGIVIGALAVVSSQAFPSYPHL